MPKQRFKIDTLGKTPRKMAQSKVLNALPAIMQEHVIIQPTIDAGQTSQTGDVFESADTEKICAPNSIVKYLNFTFELAIKQTQVAFSGWMEWALVTIENAIATPTTPSNAQLGIRTLGDVMSHEFRNRCIMTGVIPVSVQSPVAVPLTFKLPDICKKNQTGKYLIMYFAFRSADSADTTTICRSMTQSMYKSYI